MDYFIEQIRAQDWEEIREWRNRQMNILRQNEEITKGQQEKYMKAYYDSCATYTPKNLLYSFLKKEQYDIKLIGYGGLVHIDWKEKIAETSFLVEPSRKKDMLSYAKEYLIFLELLRDYTAKLGLKRWRSATLTKTGDFTRNLHKTLIQELFKMNGLVYYYDKRGYWIQEWEI